MTSQKLNFPNPKFKILFKLITTGCMKGGYDYNEEDQYEEPLDPSSTVDFHMKGLKGKQI